MSDEELARRRAEWKPRESLYPRGFGRLYAQHVTQADKGCDFDFLEGTAPIPEPGDPLREPETGELANGRAGE